LSIILNRWIIFSAPVEMKGFGSLPGFENMNILFVVQPPCIPDPPIPKSGIIPQKFRIKPYQNTNFMRKKNQ
jgi:hypothetical protein